MTTPITNDEPPFETLRFKVDLPALFKEIAHSTEVRESPGAIMGLEVIQKCLYTIAQRAIELGDEPILIELEVMGCIHAQESEETHAEDR